MTGRIVSLAAIVAGLALTACAGPTYYGVRYQYDLKNLLTADAQPPGPGARDLVKRAVTVAFYPPDYCRETTAAGLASGGNAESLRLRCGVQMSDLETEATRAGFQVVSWQTLRYTSPIEAARANKVDILFEINELSWNYKPEDIYSLTDMRFFRRAKARSDPAQPVVLQDIKTTGDLCKKKFGDGLQEAVAAVLDVKMVGVSDSRVHWVYSSYRVDEPSKERDFSRTWSVQPIEGSGSGFTTWGSVGLGLGLGGVLIGGILMAVNDDGDPGMGTAAAASIAVGVLAALGGLGIWGIGAVVDYLFPNYPPPDSVICAQDSIETAQAAVKAAPVAGSSVQVAPEGTRSDPYEARKRELFKAVIRDFMAQLKYLKQ